MVSHRWDRCIDYYDQNVKFFFAGHFSESHRKCLFIGGAGFDPRATQMVRDLEPILKTRLSCLLIKEERPNPDVKLINKANETLQVYKDLKINNELLLVNIFAEDNAVVGGNNTVSRLADYNLSAYSDIVIDFSALSIGISFPLVKYVYDKVREGSEPINIHLVVVSNPELDSMIVSAPNDRVTEVRGFPRRDKLHGEPEKARLWLPQLSGGRRETLKLIFEAVQPHDTCPILPFPSDDPKRGDKLVTNFISELEDEWAVDNWAVDARNIVYAAERNPLDIYRTILRIDDERKPVFESFGGSVVILSPLGSKMLAIGALMAALEREFPVVYVEALEYNVDWSTTDKVVYDNSKTAHVWLYGEAYLRDIEKSTS